MNYCQNRMLGVDPVPPVPSFLFLLARSARGGGVAAILAERIFLWLARERLIEQRGFIRIRTPGGQGLMSASSAFGSQSSRSPQARAPILALSLSSSLPPACSNPFFLYPFSPPKANPIGTRFYFSRSSRFILHGLPRPTISFHLVHFYSPESTLFTFYPLSNVPLLASFFFFKIRDDEISFFLFFAS